MKVAEVIQKVEQLPQDLLQSASDYIDYLLERATKQSKGGKTKKRKLGALKGKLWIADDFDAPLEDMKDYM